MEFIKKRINLTIFLTLFLLSILYLLTNFTLSGLVLFVLGSFLIFIFFNFKPIFKIHVIAVLICALFAFIFLLTSSGKDVLTKIEGESSRVRNYETSIQIAKNLPVFGYGVGNELNVLQENRNPNSWEYINKYNGHNQYFELLIGGGWLLLMLFLVAIILSLFQASKNNDLLLTLFIIIISFTMLIESLLVVHKGFIFVSYFWAYLISSRER